MVEQAIAPYLRRSEGRGDVVAEVLSLVINFHAALVRSGMEQVTARPTLPAAVNGK